MGEVCEESKRQHKILVENRNRLKDTKNRLMITRREGFRGWVKKGKGLRSPKWQSQNSHKDVNSLIGNVVNTIVITRSGARWVLEITGGPLCKVYDCLTTMLYT